MDQLKLGKAARLLAKAEATTFEHEAVALAERAYRMVGDVLSAEDENQGRGAVQRRERRRLWDRRLSRRLRGDVEVRERPHDAASSYRLRSGQPEPPSTQTRPGNIDLTA